MNYGTISDEHLAAKLNDAVFYLELEGKGVDLDLLREVDKRFCKAMAGVNKEISRLEDTINSLKCEIDDLEAYIDDLEDQL